MSDVVSAEDGLRIEICYSGTHRFFPINNCRAYIIFVSANRSRALVFVNICPETVLSVFSRALFVNCSECLSDSHEVPPALPDFLMQLCNYGTRSGGH